jgi:hypothetical protein
MRFDLSQGARGEIVDDRRNSARPAMSLFTALTAFGRKIARGADRLVAEDAAAAFTCGQCDRNESCGLPPSRECLHRLMLLSEGRQYSARPARWPAGPLGIL